MRSRWVFSVLAALTILFAVNAGAQGTFAPPQPPPAGASAAPLFTPEQIAKMPVGALPVRDFKLLTSGTGWVSTGNRLLLTTDNGAHWKDISPPVPDLPDPRENKFSGVFFLDSNTGWLLYATNTGETNADGQPYGYDIHLASTTDGGANWNTVSQLPRLNPWADLTGGGNVAFSDKLHGWADLGVIRGGVLFATSDGGRTWQRPKGDPQAGVDIVALTDKDIWFAGGPDELLYVTHDGGNTVEEVSLPNPPEIGPEDYPIYGLPVFTDSLNGYEVVNYRSPLGSKSAAAFFATQNGGRTWKSDRVLSNLVENEIVNSAVAGSTWILPFAPQGALPTLLKLRPNEMIAAPDHKTSGDFRRCSLSFFTADEGWMSCSGKLSSTIDGGSSWTEIIPGVRNGVLTTDPVTPTQSIPIQKKAKHSTAVPAVAPAFHIIRVGVDQHLGFDSSDVLSVGDMQIWWSSSPYYDVGIYLPGSPNRSTKHKYATADWVDAVMGQGWGIFPIWFGLQSECIVSRTGVSQYISSDPTPVKCKEEDQTKVPKATCQGIEQADKAYDQVTKLGLDGSPVYFDIEPYNTQTKSCSAAVSAYVGAFVKEMHEVNTPSGIVGVYGNVFAGGSDFYNASPRPDELWIANNSGHRVTVWNLNAKALGQPPASSGLTDAMWPNYQRMNQYAVDVPGVQPIVETWGDVTAEIDDDLVDATVVQSSGVKDMTPTSYSVINNLPENGGFLAINNGVNDSSGLHFGEAVGAYTTTPAPPYTWAGFTYKNGAVTETPELYPTAINSLGQVILETGAYAPSITAPTQNLDFPSADGNVYGINDAGWISGVYADGRVDSNGYPITHCVLFKPDKNGNYSNPIVFDIRAKRTQRA
jgi:photosystem II stability/assembly factor-like uncharacterized protein